MLAPFASDHTPSASTVALTGSSSVISKYVMEASVEDKVLGEVPNCVRCGMNVMDGPDLELEPRIVFAPT